MTPTQTVALSTGEAIIVGPLRWSGYKIIRDVIVSEALPGVLQSIQPLLASEQVAAPLQRFFEGRGDSLNVSEVGEALQALLDGALADLLWRASRWSDELAEALVEHATTPSTRLEDLAYADAAALRDAATAVNDLAALVALEKNWLAALAGAGRKLLGAGQTSNPAGTPGGSPSSSGPTAGDPPTSTD
jgi:hypothetical protein